MNDKNSEETENEILARYYHIKSSKENITYMLISEFLFILMPFIVLAIVTSYKTSIIDLIHIPEWSLSAAILFGLTIVKLVAGSTVAVGVHWQRAVLVISLFLVIGLVPSLIVLALVLISNEQVIGLTIAQFVLFSLAVFVYFYFGKAGHSLLENIEE